MVTSPVIPDNGFYIIDGGATRLRRSKINSFVCDFIHGDNMRCFFLKLEKYNEQCNYI